MFKGGLVRNNRVVITRLRNSSWREADSVWTKWGCDTCMQILRAMIWLKKTAYVGKRMFGKMSQTLDSLNIRIINLISEYLLCHKIFSVLTECNSFGWNTEITSQSYPHSVIIKLVLSEKIVSKWIIHKIEHKTYNLWTFGSTILHLSAIWIHVYENKLSNQDFTFSDQPLYTLTF